MLILHCLLGFQTINSQLFDKTQLNTNSTRSEPKGQLIGIALSIPVYVLHGLCLVICLVAIIFNSVPFCAKRIPPLMLFVFLVSTAFFNIAGCVLIGICSRRLTEANLEPKFSYLLRSSTVSYSFWKHCIISGCIRNSCPRCDCSRRPQLVLSCQEIKRI